jgi:hypothetical protein
MTLSPNLIAGYEAAKELLKDHDVRVKRPGQSAMEYGLFMRDHSVNVACWNSHVVVTGVIRHDDPADIETIAYPLSHEDPEFKAKLGELLVPLVEKHLARVRESANR